MQRSIYSSFKAVAAALLLLLLVGVSANAGGKSFDGRWTFNITIPESPTSGTKQTMTVTLDVSPRGTSLNGRLTVTDSQNRTVSGAWRQFGTPISVTYELPN